MSEGMRVELLGTVRALRGGAELDLGSAHRRAVLAVLAMSVGQVVSRAELIDALWGERPPASANGSIYTYVSSLRRALDSGRSGVLTSRGSGYALSLSPDAIDTHAFDLHRERAQARYDSGDLAGALDELGSALRLWRGEPLSGLPGPFAERHRARLAELRIATLERRAEIALASGAHHEAFAELRALVREHPLRETPRALLMTALARDGRQAEALDVYEDARTTLIECSGTEPSPALRAVHDRIMSRASAPSAPPLPKPPATLTGRDDEIALLRGKLAELAGGSGGAVGIEGEPGIGKSALLARICADVPSGVRLCWGSCDELDRRYPLRWLDGHLGAGATDEDRIVAWVTQRCARAPLAIVLDDLHWADETSLRVLPRLLHATAELPLLLIGAFRPVPDRAELRHLLAEAGVLALGPLSGPAVHALVGARAGGTPGSALSEVTALAAGNPRYLHETLDALLTEGAIVHADGVADLAEDSEFRHALPAVLVAAVTRDLGFLSAGTRAFLRWAALLGSEFTLDEAVTGLEQPAAEVAGSLAEARAAFVITESGEAFSFRHPLVRQVLHDATPGAIRVAVHRQFAESLARSGAPVARVAEQLAAPVPVDGWVVGWLTANADELGTTAPQLATDLFTHALAQPGLDAQTRTALADVLARLKLLRAAAESRTPSFNSGTG